MKITQLDVHVSDLQAAAQFYGEVLGLPVLSDRTSHTVVIGSTHLVLRHGATPFRCLHLAFTIPSGSFDSAKNWLRSRVALLTHGSDDEFECAPAWNARSLYFDGPDGAILELIERRNLDNSREEPFDASGILCVSEVGIPVVDVPSMIATLDEFDIRPFGQSGDQFAPVGDDEGLIILVAPDRAWFPTEDRLAQDMRLQLTIEGRIHATLALNSATTLVVSQTPSSTG